MRETKLKEGDTVLVIAGGNKTSNQLKGRTGKIIRFVGSGRVLVSGLNLVAKHKRAQSADKPAGIKFVEAPISIANVMFYVDSIAKPVRLKLQTSPDGKNIRGYLDPITKVFHPV